MEANIQNLHADAMAAIKCASESLTPCIKKALTENTDFIDGAGAPMTMRHAFRNIQHHKDEDKVNNNDMFAEIRQNAGNHKQTLEILAAQTDELLALGTRSHNVMRTLRVRPATDSDSCLAPGPTSRSHRTISPHLHRQSNDRSRTHHGLVSIAEAHGIARLDNRHPQSVHSNSPFLLYTSECGPYDATQLLACLLDVCYIHNDDNSNLVADMSALPLTHRKYLIRSEYLNFIQPTPDHYTLPLECYDRRPFTPVTPDTASVANKLPHARVEAGHSTDC